MHEKETKGKFQNSELISHKKFISGTIQVLDSTMRKPTLTLLGHLTMKLGKSIMFFRIGD